MRNGTTVDQNQDGRGFPVSRIETISKGTIDPQRVRYVELNDADLNKWRLLHGDILFSHINSEEHIGKSAIFAGTPEVLVQGMNLLLLRPNPSLVLPEFLHYFLRSETARDHVRSRCKRAINQASINQKELGALQFALPALQEQRSIVDLLTRAEGIVRLRREAAAKAAELIPAIFIDMFGDPAKNPKRWPTSSLGELATLTSGGTPSKSRPDYWAGDLPWVSPKDMKRDLISDAIDHVHPKVLDETTLKLIPAGTVLIVVRGMILVHTVPVALTTAPVVINQDMKALQLTSELSSTYLLWLLKVSQPRLLELVSTAAHGTKKLETKDLVALKIPLPPMSLQRQFLERVQAIESILTQQADAIEKAQATFNALLAQAFSPPTSSASPQE